MNRAMVYRDLVGGTLSQSDCHVPHARRFETSVGSCLNPSGMFKLSGVHIPGLAQADSVPLVDSMVVGYELALLRGLQRIHS